jgi:hypothetical protein
MKKYCIQLYGFYEEKFLKPGEIRLKDYFFRSPKSIKSFLGKRGLKLKFETKFRWAILSNDEIVGFFKILQ